MAVMTTFSRSVGDPRRMAEELLDGLPGDMGDDPVGFLSCSNDCPFEEMNAILGETASFPIIGGTTVGLPLEERDSDVLAQLTVISRPGMTRSLAVTAPITADNGTAALTAAYGEIVAALGAPPRLLVVFFPFMPELEAGNHFPQFFAALPDIPVFGGLVSADLDAGNASVLVNGQRHTDRAAMIGLGGSIEPVFGVGCDVTVPSDYFPTITSASGTRVHGVDDMTLCDYLRQLNLEPENAGSLNDFPLSFLYSDERARRLDIATIKTLVKVEPETGSGVFGSPMPVGSRISLGYLNLADIETSTNHCLDQLERGIREGGAAGYDFSVVMVASCVGRFFHLAGGENIEADLIRERIGGALPLFGYYKMGEVAPVVTVEGHMFNQMHHYSLAMCAF